MEKKSCDLIVRGRFVFPMTDGYPVLEDAGVVIVGDAIAAVGPAGEIAARWEPREAIEGDLVLPGLVNTHGHAAMTLYRGFGHGLPLHIWLNDFVWPVEKKFTTTEAVALGTELAIAEMISAGTTTFADMYFFEDAVAEVCARTGMRALLSEGMLSGGTPSTKHFADALAYTERMVHRWKGHPLVNMSMGLHAVYTLTLDELKEGARQAERWGIPVQIHVCETALEVAECREAHGKSPIQLLDHIGALLPGTICAHGVHLAKEDVELLKKAGAGVALNLKTNLLMGSGIADVHKLHQAGVRIGLGADGATSNHNLDLWEVVSLAALLPKGVYEDPTLISSQEVIDFATRGGAELLGLGMSIGTLEKGKKGDLCVLDISSAAAYPFYSAWPYLAYTATGRDVRHTVIGGRVVYKDRQLTTIDLSGLQQRMNALTGEIATFGRQLSAAAARNTAR